MRDVQVEEASYQDAPDDPEGDGACSPHGGLPLHGDGDAHGGLPLHGELTSGVKSTAVVLDNGQFTTKKDRAAKEGRVENDNGGAQDENGEVRNAAQENAGDDLTIYALETLMMVMADIRPPIQ